MSLPQAVSAYMIEWLQQRHRFGYIMLDPQGRVVSWGGQLERMGIRSIDEGRNISEMLVFMEGLLPIEEYALELPMVRTESDHVLDVHLIRTDTGYGLLLLDASGDAEIKRSFQQQFNERALKNEMQSGQRDTSDVRPQFELIENVFYACNIVVMQLVGDGRFSIIGRAPGWLTEFCPSLVDGICRLDQDNVFSFLDNFIHDAHEFWAQEKAGCLKSGLWIELDTVGKEHLFEATAIHSGLNKILVIAKEHSMLTEKKALIQKGREIALGRNTLERSQSELLADRDDLESRVKQRTRELEKINIQLARELDHRKHLEMERAEILNHLQQAQKMEAIGTLAGGIAHDFNNILSSVIGFTELSLMETAEDSQLRANLQHVFAAGQRAKKLIRQILTFSRQSNPETQPVRISLIIKEAIELLRASLPANIEIRQDLKSDAYVMADPSQMHQVVMNLCTNASHAMFSDEGVLKVSLRDYDIGAESSATYPSMLPGTYLELTIEDNGSGMSKETLTRIYDPFFTTKDKGQGTGLGLSVVHGIVKNCKGDIAVTSQIGRGTTFRILLPTIKHRDPNELALNVDLPHGHERILFVDDEPLHTDLAMKILTPLGYQVEAFTDSPTALSRFSENPNQFDLILTDMYMPKMTGKVLSREIARLRPDIPVILCSGYGDNLTDMQPFDQHITHYLMKPFGRSELAMTIRRILDQKR